MQGVHWSVESSTYEPKKRSITVTSMSDTYKPIVYLALIIRITDVFHRQAKNNSLCTTCRAGSIPQECALHRWLKNSTQTALSLARAAVALLLPAGGASCPSGPRQNRPFSAAE